MKLYVCALALAAVPLFGGKLIEMESTDLSSNKTTPRRTMIDTDRLAVVMPDSKIIFRTDGGKSRFQIVDLKRNTYTELDEETMKQLASTMNDAMAQMNAAMANMPPEQRAMMEKMMKGKMPGQAPAAPAITFSKTGSGSVAGYACTKYEGMQGAQKVMDVCASPAAALKLASGEAAVFEKMRQFSKSMMDAMKNSPMGNLIAANATMTAGFEGYPVEETLYSNGKANMKETLKSISDQSFSDADFSVGNAKKTDLNLPNLKGKR